jgi:hydrogenase 3 maturation protease
MKKALLVLGNYLRGDDAAALYLGEIVQKKLPDWKVFFGEDTPEDEFFDIKSYSPDILVLADTVIGLEEKSAFLELKKSYDYFFTTHNIPVEILIKLLKEFCPNTLFLGINVPPKNIAGINNSLSYTAKEHAEDAFLKIQNLEKLLLFSKN